MQSATALARLLLAVADPHRFRAQLWPALLLALPPSLALLAEHRIETSDVLLALSLFIGLGGAWLVSQVIQACGRKCLHELFKSSGGRPAIQILRHRDRAVDRDTKLAFHARYASRLGIHFPSRAEEQLNPRVADAIYGRAVAARERDTGDRLAFPALWSERTDCEFLVNGLALRWLGLTACAGAALWTCVGHSSLSIGLRPSLELMASASLHFGSARVVLVSTALGVAWLFFFTPNRARAAAYFYDLHLLESDIDAKSPHVACDTAAHEVSDRH